MFQQRLLICVVSVVGRENAHFPVIHLALYMVEPAKSLNREEYQTLAVVVDVFSPHNVFFYVITDKLHRKKPIFRAEQACT